MPASLLAYLGRNLGLILPSLADQELRGRNFLFGFLFDLFLL